MGKIEKYLFGEAGILNLVGGIIRIFIAVVIILSAYSLILERGPGDQIFIRATIERTLSMLVASLAVLFLGIWGGYEIGRYIQTQFNKRQGLTGEASPSLNTIE